MACLGALAAGPAHAQTATDLSTLSLEELAEVQVTSVSKRAQSIREAPSAVYVISGEDIARSSATSLPEALRLAPNLQVTQAGSSRYVITARGFNGAPAAQNFSNKLLVLIDGRTVYTPLYSGVYWDMQDVLLQDIERIEVISGPGATLWGSNAVNGVINIITKSASETAGGLAAVTAGDWERSAALRYAGSLSPTLNYRLYAKTFFDRSATTRARASAHDHWSKPQAGGRLDWAPSTRDAVTLQGDVYDGWEAQAGAPAEDINGQNLMLRWNRALDAASSLQIQTFYDRVERGQQVNGSGFHVRTYDVDLQYSGQLGRHAVVAGGGYRNVRYLINGTASLQFAPRGRTLQLWNGFIQDSMALGSGLQLVLGAKVEDGAYEKAQILPNAQLAWTPGGAVTLWASASRAVRAPTPFDRDVVEILGGGPFLIGGPDFESEKLTAYQLGAKTQAFDRLSLSAAAYYNDYDDLRSIEVAPGGFLPLRWGNRMRGHTYGVEVWGDYRVTPAWRLSASVVYMDQKFAFKPGASRILGASQAANDPKYRASLSSSVDLSDRLSLDTSVRYVSALPDPRVLAYAELDARLGWRLTEQVTVAIAGRNLLHDDHIEYTDGARIPRSLFVDLQWRF